MPGGPLVSRGEEVLGPFADPPRILSRGWALLFGEKPPTGTSADFVNTERNTVFYSLIVFRLACLVSCLLSKLPFGKFAFRELTLSPHTVSTSAGQERGPQDTGGFASWFQVPPITCVLSAAVVGLASLSEEDKTSDAHLNDF